jgi:hypothetical protein
MFVVPMTATPQRGRPFYIAAIAMAGGLAFSVATACGGALAAVLPREVIVFGHAVHNLQILFVASAVLRACAAFAALRIQEPAAAGVSAVFPEVLALARRRVGLAPAPGRTPRDPDSVAA